jgi:hypothetical protein
MRSICIYYFIISFLVGRGPKNHQLWGKINPTFSKTLYRKITPPPISNNFWTLPSPFTLLIKFCTLKLKSNKKLWGANIYSFFCRRSHQTKIAFSRIIRKIWWKSFHQSEKFKICLVLHLTHRLSFISPFLNWIIKRKLMINLDKVFISFLTSFSCLFLLEICSFFKFDLLSFSAKIVWNLIVLLLEWIFE